MVRLREWAAKWLVGAAAFLYLEVSGSFLPRMIFQWSHQPLSYAVVSLGFVMSALAAPVTHQDQGLQKNESSSSATPVPHSGTQKIFGSRPCPNGSLQISWL
jgi:hypothetical protein